MCARDFGLKGKREGRKTEESEVGRKEWGGGERGKPAESERGK